MAKASLKALPKLMLRAGALLVITVAALYAYELYVAAFDKDAKNFWWKYPREPLPVSPQAVATRTSGTISSVYANLDYRGPSNWDARHGITPPRTEHIRSNRFGFYTEYPVDDYPPKAENEFRIVLFGGSGAQGHGASSNEKMMYSVLERKLNAALADAGATVKVVNLALPGQTPLESARTLLAFGHKVQPDLILGYSGPNEIGQFVPSYFGVACTQYYDNLISSTFVAPEWLRTLGEYFPALVYRAGLLKSVKTRFYADQYREQAADRCLRDLSIDPAYKPRNFAVWRDGVVPMTIEQMQGIKRDFCGIPMMIAWAAAADTERAAWDQQVKPFDPETNPAATVYSDSSELVEVDLRNPERRTIYLLTMPAGSEMPTREQVISSGTASTRDGKRIRLSTPPAGSEGHSQSHDTYYAFDPPLSVQEDAVYRAPTSNELHQAQRRRNIYTESYERLRAALTDYLNPYWYFLDVDREAQKIDPETVPGMTSSSIQVHLDDVGQEVVAGIINEHLAPIVRDLIGRTDRPGCPKTAAAEHPSPIVTQSLPEH